MAASYPGSIKSFTTKADNVDDVLAADVNSIQDEVVAIETQLGANCGTWAAHTATVTASSGTFTTVSGGNRYFTMYGKTRVLSGLVYITTKGTAAGTLRVTIPSGAPAALLGGSWSGSGYANSGSVVVKLAGAGTYLEILLYDNSTTVIGDGVTISYHIIYELA